MENHCNIQQKWSPIHIRPTAEEIRQGSQVTLMIFFMIYVQIQQINIQFTSFRTMLLTYIAQNMRIAQSLALQLSTAMVQGTDTDTDTEKCVFP